MRNVWVIEQNMKYHLQKCDTFCFPDYIFEKSENSGNINFVAHYLYLPQLDTWKYFIVFLSIRRIHTKMWLFGDLKKYWWLL